MTPTDADMAALLDSDDRGPDTPAGGQWLALTEEDWV